MTKTRIRSQVTKRRIARRGDVRELILDGVEVLLARYGYRKMTMEDVARQVGIGKGTIYLHFPGKEELVLSHVDRVARKVLVELRGIAVSGGPAAERLREMLRARVLIRFDSVLRYSQGLGDLLASVRSGLLARRESHFLAEAAVLEGALREGVKSGELACANPAAAARALCLGTNALLPFNLSARELGRRKDVEEQVADIADLLIKGLMPGLERVRPPLREGATTPFDRRSEP